MTTSDSPRAIIITNGHLADPDAVRRHIRPGDRIIGVDGGTRHAWAMGLMPDVVVGDLDVHIQPEVGPSLTFELTVVGELPVDPGDWASVEINPAGVVLLPVSDFRSGESVVSGEF